MIKKLNDLRREISVFNWNGYGNPFIIIDALSIDLLEKEKELATLRAKVEILESLKKEGDANEKK